MLTSLSLLQKLAAEKGGHSGHPDAGSSHHLSPFDRSNQRNFPGADTPALRQLSEYARPHGAGLFSPSGYPRTSLAGPMPGQSPSSAAMAAAAAGLGLGPGGFPGHPGSNPGMDLLHYQIASGMYVNVARDASSSSLQSDQETQNQRKNLYLRDAVEREMLLMSDAHAAQSFAQHHYHRYGPGAIERARLEAEEREKREIEKREREMKEMEMKSRMAAAHAAAMSSPANAFEAQMAELQRRYGGGPVHGSSGPSGLPPPFGFLPPGERERLLGPPPGSNNQGNQSSSSSSSSAAAAEAAAAQLEHRIQTERLAAMSSDPIVRLQMANLANELHNHAHTHAHTHAHAHTHLHLHPQDPMAAAAAAAAASMGLSDGPPHHPLSLAPPGSGNSLPRPPSGMSRSDPSLLPPPGLMRPSFDEQLAHQV